MDGTSPSIWASLYGWFSPTVLFVLLNLVIGTIAVTSKVGGRRGEAEEGGADHPDEQRKIARTPSAVFGRLRSFKFSRQTTFEMGTATTETITHHESPPPPPAAAAAADAAQQEQQPHFIRSQSDAQPTAGEMPPKLPAKLKKSASAKSAFAHFEVEDILPAPEEEVEEEEVKEVDAKADAFINRFRQQLQLQRLDSILRYKEMLHRGR